MGLTIRGFVVELGRWWCSAASGGGATAPVSSSGHDGARKGEKRSGMFLTTLPKMATRSRRLSGVGEVDGRWSVVDLRRGRAEAQWEGEEWLGVG